MPLLSSDDLSSKLTFSEKKLSGTISNSLDPDQNRHSVIQTVCKCNQQTQARKELIKVFFILNSLNIMMKNL